MQGRREDLPSNSKNTWEKRLGGVDRKLDGLHTHTTCYFLKISPEEFLSHNTES